MFAFLTAAFALASTVTAAPLSFQLSSIVSHTPSGRSQPALDSISFTFTDPNNNNASAWCDLQWDYTTDVPTTEQACNVTGFSFKVDDRVSSLEFDLSLQHSFDTTTIWGYANFSDASHWSYQCGGSGQCTGSIAGPYEAPVYAAIA